MSVDAAANGRQLKEQRGIQYRVLADETTQVTRQYALYDMHGDGVSAPAVFVLDHDGVITWRHIGRDAPDRPPVSVIRAALEALG